MKPSQILAFAAAPFVSVAAPIASPQAPKASSPPAPGFTIGRELSSSDLEKCRLPTGAMNQSCAAILWHRFIDLEGQLRALQENHELDDVSDEEYSTLVAELEDPEMAREDGFEPFTGEIPSDLQRRGRFPRPLKYHEHDQGDCGSWIEHKRHRNNFYPIPASFCQLLYEIPAAKTPEGDEVGNCGDWRDADGKDHPINVYVCKSLMDDLWEQRRKTPPWFGRSAAAGRAEAIERRQLVTPQIDEQPGDCGTWADHLGGTYAIPQDYCEMLNQYPEFKQPEEGEEGDCGSWQDTDGVTFPLDFYTCGMLEQQFINPIIPPYLPLPDQHDDAVGGKHQRRQIFPPADHMPLSRSQHPYCNEYGCDPEALEPRPYPPFCNEFGCDPYTDGPIIRSTLPLPDGPAEDLQRRQLEPPVHNADAYPDHEHCDSVVGCGPRWPAPRRPHREPCVPELGCGPRWPAPRRPHPKPCIPELGCDPLDPYPIVPDPFPEPPLFIPDIPILEPRDEAMAKYEPTRPWSAGKSCTTYFNGMEEKGTLDAEGECVVTGGNPLKG